MSSRPRAALLIVLILSMSAVVVWRLHREMISERAGSRSDAAGATPPSHVVDAVQPVDRDTASVRRRAATPLPADDARLADVFTFLKAQADAGDGHAACRLAVDLIDCGDAHRYDVMLGQARDQESADDKQGNLDSANAAAGQQEAILALRQRCAGIGKERIAMAGAYLRQAAKDGVLEAMVRYADGQAFDDAAPLAALQSPLFDAWRREAPAMMRVALRRGRPEAVDALANAYVSDRELFSALIPDDPLQAQTFYRLQLHLLGPEAGSAVSSPEQSSSTGANVRLSSRQHRFADADAARLFRLHFGGRRLAAGQSMSGWLNHGPLATMQDDRSAAGHCR